MNPLFWTCTTFRLVKSTVYQGYRYKDLKIRLKVKLKATQIKIYTLKAVSISDFNLVS